jgi:predicted unusual protein kinase regulating ubiquinone biosynthesis (AarF/ABC1/UbiB family)
MGRKALLYLARRPFLSEEKRLTARQTLNRETAVALFEGLSMLRGTALKAAQMLSMELDLFPPEVTEELNKACHDVPPINRALARKVVQNALGGPPEAFFTTFDANAFAAASLGQVHRATTKEGEALAVKIQYPGIRETIHSDMRLMRAALRAHPDRRSLEPVMAEIEARLLEETDYGRELRNMAFFRERLGMDRVEVPAAWEDLSADTVLAAGYLPGMPINDWLRTGPDQKTRDRVGQTIQDLFVTGLYRLRCIHADPNPGNFLVLEGGKVGLVDFGCVKYFDDAFVSLYKELLQDGSQGDKNGYIALLQSLGITKPDLDSKARNRIFTVFVDTSKWLSQLYQDEYFDFKSIPGFIARGNQLMRQTYALRRHLNINSNFIFLHRTRYGLLRLFERMEARICFRNPYEWRQPAD